VSTGANDVQVRLIFVLVSTTQVRCFPVVSSRGCVMNEFGCPVCLSPALVYPKILEDDQPVACAECGAFVSTFGEIGTARRTRADPDQRWGVGLLNPSPNHISHLPLTRDSLPRSRQHVNGLPANFTPLPKPAGSDAAAIPGPICPLTLRRGSPISLQIRRLKNPV
jgi:hypothetical protein